MKTAHNHLRTIAYAKKYCKDDVTLIENYDKMMADPTQIWVTHHIREIDENKSKLQLIAEGRYYNVPASELIFMTASDHSKLHTKLQMIGNKYGVGNKGVPKSEEHRRNIGVAKKDTKWWNNGIINKRAKECPGEGFTLGQLRKERSL